MRLFELLQQPYVWQMIVHDDEEMVAQFHAKSGIVITTLNGMDNEWILSFNVAGSYDVTGGGDAFRIFATVVEISKQMIATVNPAKFYFTAWPEDSSRVKLYKRLATMVAKGTNYDLEVWENSIQVKFEFVQRKYR